MVAGAGSQGKRPYGVKISSEPGIPAVDVLSEGEAKCVALAGLLAEIEITGNRSAIVLDDPVTSLDHNYRERVAMRLVDEARNRQVVVLTHDIVFLFLLGKYAQAAAISFAQLGVERGGGNRGHGRATNGPPWVTLKVNDRIKRLRRELEVARRLHNAGNQAEYEKAASELYEQLRKAWERAVEEVLLGGAVLRFDDAIHTKPLGSIADDVLKADVAMIETQMAYCSGFVHDRAGPAASRPPGPDVVGGDIDKLDDWCKQVRKRRR